MCGLTRDLPELICLAANDSVYQSTYPHWYCTGHLPARELKHRTCRYPLVHVGSCTDTSFQSFAKSAASVARNTTQLRNEFQEALDIMAKNLVDMRSQIDDLTEQIKDAEAEYVGMDVVCNVSSDFPIANACTS